MLYVVQKAANIIEACDRTMDDGVTCAVYRHGELSRITTPCVYRDEEGEHRYVACSLFTSDGHAFTELLHGHLCGPSQETCDHYTEGGTE